MLNAFYRRLLASGGASPTTTRRCTSTGQRGALPEWPGPTPAQISKACGTIIYAARAAATRFRRGRVPAERRRARAEVRQEHPPPAAPRVQRRGGMELPDSTRPSTPACHGTAERAATGPSRGRSTSWPRGSTSRSLTASPECGFSPRRPACGAPSSPGSSANCSTWTRDAHRRGHAGGRQGPAQRLGRQDGGQPPHHLARSVHHRRATPVRRDDRQASGTASAPPTRTTAS